MSEGVIVSALSQLKQILVAVYSGVVAVSPLDAESIVSNRPDTDQVGFLGKSALHYSKHACRF